MINISQWISSIGLWACHHVSYSTHSVMVLNTNTSIRIVGKTIARKIKDLTFSLGVFVSLLLILSGDVELNPGPKTGNQLKTMPICCYIYIILYTCVYVYIYIWIR